MEPELRIVGPKFPRAERIRPHVWEHYKKPILQKYATMMLKELKMQMEKEYGFTAT